MTDRPELTVLHYLGYDTDRGGILSVVRALAGTGEFACVLGVNAGFIGRCIPAVETRRFSPVEGEVISARALWRARRVAAEVREWLAHDRSRVFHGHSRAGMLVGLWLHRWGERRVVVSVHCYGRQRWFYRWTARRLGGRVFWLSPAMKGHYGINDAETWTQCIPGCIPADAVRPRGHRRGAADLRLGGVGSLVPWKRWELVLAVIARIRATAVREVRFTHIGASDGSAGSERYARTLRARVTELGIADRVEFRGQQSSADPLWSEIDALVIAADNEPFSIAMLEALGAGAPVIAADSGGARDVIRDGRNGWLFRSGDAADLARVVESLANSEASAVVRIDEAKLRPFTAPVVAAQWMEVYRRVGSAGSARERG